LVKLGHLAQNSEHLLHTEKNNGLKGLPEEMGPCTRNIKYSSWSLLFQHRQNQYPKPMTSYSPPARLFGFFSCVYDLTVPLDYSDPYNNDRYLRIPMVKIPAKNPVDGKRKALFTNPGGPAISGVNDVAGGDYTIRE